MSLSEVTINQMAQDTYGDMNDDGRKELLEYAGGRGKFEVKTFKGTGLTIAELFDSSSEALLLHLAEQIEKIGEQTGIKLAVAGIEKSGVRPHGTISDGKYDSDLDHRTVVYERVKSDPRIKPVLESLKGLDIRFNRLIIRSKSILLATTYPPMPIIKAREDVKAIFADHALVQSREKDPIFYITLARLTEPPPRETIPNYLAALEKIQQQLIMRPIATKTEIPFIGPAINMIPQQLRPPGL